MQFLLRCLLTLFTLPHPLRIQFRAFRSEFILLNTRDDECYYANGVWIARDHVEMNMHISPPVWYSYNFGYSFFLCMPMHTWRGLLSLFDIFASMYFFVVLSVKMHSASVILHWKRWNAPILDVVWQANNEKNLEEKKYDSNIIIEPFWLWNNQLVLNILIGEWILHIFFSRPLHTSSSGTFPTCFCD